MRAERWSPVWSSSWSRFRAMGSDVVLLAVGDEPEVIAAALEGARSLVERLERCWSRFRPDSELSRLNADDNHVTVLTSGTFALVALAVAAWRHTAGRFDPTVLPALVSAGYDRTFEELGSGRAGPPGEVGPAPGCDGLRLDPTRRTVWLPAGVSLDLGGVGKGRAADLAVDHLLRAGAAGAMADLGGDVRVAGDSPEGDSWVVAVEDPHQPGAELARLALSGGAVATTSRTRRRWVQGGSPCHHLIDPATGRPADPGLASVTVIAAEASWAEVLAKAAFVAGPTEGAEMVRAAGATGLLVDDDGEVVELPGLEEYRR